MNKVITKNSCKKGLLLLLILGILLQSVQVNTVEAASSYPYLIKVNKQQNTVTVYKKDAKGNYTVPHKAMVCSVGWDTPIGTFKTPVKYRWRLLMGDVWGQYSTRIVGGILFHSVWYYQQNPSTLSDRQYNKLGTTASHGCIRLTVADAKWIYDNCPIGTTVTIYNSKDPGPLGKPTAAKLPGNSGWDPTDVTNPNNPWNKKTPSISGTKNQTVKFGTKVNLLTGVTAKSTTGETITSRIKTTGKVDTKTPGKYKVTYKVTDPVGKTATKTVTYTVLEDETKPVIKGVKDQTINGSTKVNRTFALKGVTAYFNKDKADSSLIKTTIKKTSDTLYTISYSLTSDTGNKTKATAKITIDAVAPEITGVADKEVDWDTTVNEELVLKGIKVTDNVTKMKKKDIKVEIEETEKGTYNVTYTASDAVGNKATETAVYKVKNSITMTGVADRTIEANVAVTEELALEGVKAVCNDEDITDQIIVTIFKTAEGNYRVNYSVEVEEGNSETLSCIFTVIKDTAPETTTDTVTDPESITE